MMENRKRSTGSLGFVDTVEGRRELISTRTGIVAAPVDNVIDLGTGRRVGRFLARRIEEIPKELMSQLVEDKGEKTKTEARTMTREDTRCANCGKYIRPDSPQRLCCAGYELLCKSCEKELNQ